MNIYQEGNYFCGLFLPLSIIAFVPVQVISFQLSTLFFCFVPFLHFFYDGQEETAFKIKFFTDVLILVQQLLATD